MDFKKFAQIVLKEIYLLLQDRAALLITLGAPLALTIVIGAAFGGLASGSGSPIKDIPVVVVNQDKGTAFGTQRVNFGENVADALKSVGDLLKVDVLTDENEARARVTQGKAVTAVIIPPDFSQSLNTMNPAFGDMKVRLTLFRDAGSPLSADIVAAVVRQITNGFMNANVAVYAAGKANANPLFLITQAGAIAQEIGMKSSSGAVIKVASAEQPASQQGPALNILQYIAPAMAVFFLNFAMAFGAVTIIEEQDNQTLQRLLVSPTSRLTILAGKLGGTYVNGLLQLTVLVVATALISPLLGGTTPVWGTNIPALILLILTVVAGSVGLGTLIAGAAKTRQQAGVYASALLMLMGIAGGAFFFSSSGQPPMGILSQLTINWWASSAFSKLAQTGDLVAILPNLAALLVIFVVSFSIGVALFNRRLSV